MCLPSRAWQRAVVPFMAQMNIANKVQITRVIHYLHGTYSLFYLYVSSSGKPAFIENFQTVTGRL